MKSKIFFGLLLLALGTGVGYALAHYPIFDFFHPASQAVKAPPEVIKPLLAVSIDNSPEARSQAGLQDADVVIETLAEGGITRFLAFFESHEAEKIGPVRSARPYFVDWALGEGAILAHSGGSKEALDEIDSSTDLKDVNEFYNEKFFWRDQTKTAPHNLLTSTELLGKLAEKKGWAADQHNWGWDTDSRQTALTANQIAKIAVNFSYAPYAVTFRYNPADNTSERVQDGSPQIAAKNLVVLYTDSTVIDKNLLTIALRTTGSDKAVVFRDGSLMQARWKKESAGGPLQLLDADGTKVALESGLTWIAVVDQHSSVSWK